MSLDKLSSIVGDGNDVTVQAGIRLYELNSQLEAMNLSLENLGQLVSKAWQSNATGARDGHQYRLNVDADCGAEARRWKRRHYRGECDS